MRNVARCTLAVLTLSIGLQAGAQSRGDLAIAVTMQTPTDVNQRPLCEELALYCSGSPRTFPELGPAVSVARNLGFGIAAVGESGFYANYWRTGPRAEDQHTNTVGSALAGVRLATPFFPYRPELTRDSIRLFAQVLAGAQWSTLDPGRPILQPGVGVDGTAKRATLRMQVDYCRVSGEGRDLSGGRFSFGLVHRFGSAER